MSQAKNRENKMVVVYYTSPFFLDAALETIRCIKDRVELHVVIELSNDSKLQTIINIKDISHLRNIEQVEEVLGEEEWSHLKPYFAGVASVVFSVHRNKGGFSLQSIKDAMAIGRYIKKMKADVIHFDSITSRGIGMYPYIRNRKIFITFHDPVPHSGEVNWKIKVPKAVFFPRAKGFFFYSDFANQQFKEYHPKIKTPLHTIRLQPYTFISQFIQPDEKKEKVILFFGRISLYKGVDILLEAIPKVLEKFPHEKFLIAGKKVAWYDMDTRILEKYPDNIQLFDGYLTNQQLVNHVRGSKFAICPYRDATQSGVLMTAFALGRMVIASNVGSFSEYIENNVNGFLAEPNSNAIASRIIEALEGEKYLDIEKRLQSTYSDKIGESNAVTILSAYHKN